MSQTHFCSFDSKSFPGKSLTTIHCCIKTWTTPGKVPSTPNTTKGMPTLNLAFQENHCIESGLPRLGPIHSEYDKVMDLRKLGRLYKTLYGKIVVIFQPIM